jgi:putative glycosyltransferase
MKLSIVTTMYRSAPHLREFVERIVIAATKITDDYEIILVNDGSPDDSLAIALNLRENNPKIIIIDLSRNFGHHEAIVAGIKFTSGKHVFLMDCDLQEQPEWLPLFWEQMEETGADVVFGVQKKRTGSILSRIGGSLFWKSINIMSKVSIPHNPMTCRLMTGSYVEALLKTEDKVIYLAGLCAWVGFDQQPIYLTKEVPLTNKSTYSFIQKIIQVADSFASFSIAPLFLVFLLGLFAWAASMLYSIFLIINKIIHPDLVLSGFTSMMISIWFLSGLILLSLGLIGLYSAKILKESKNRPLFITKKIYKGDNT